MAAIGILHERAVRRYRATSEQLQGALTSRVLIEQAKGVLAERRHIPVAAAFVIMRDYARRNGLRLPEVAKAVIAGHDELSAPATVRPRTGR